MSLKKSSAFSRNFGTAGLGTVDTAIVKATFDDDMPPKEKHITTMLDDLSQRNQCLFYPSLFGRLKEKSFRVVLKTLIVTHRLCRDSDGGTVFRLVQNHSRLASLSTFRDPSSSALSALVRLYATYLQQKLFVYSTYRFSPERVAPADAKEWVAKLTLKQCSQVLPLLQEQLFRLTNITASYPLVPLQEVTFTMLLRDGMRLFAVVSMIIPVLAQELENLDLDMTTTLFKCCVRTKDLNKSFLFWFESLVRARITSDTPPKISDLPQTFLDALQNHITTLQRNNAAKNDAEVGFEPERLKNVGFDDFEDDEWVVGDDNDKAANEKAANDKAANDKPVPPSPAAEPLDSFLTTPKVAGKSGPVHPRAFGNNVQSGQQPDDIFTLFNSYKKESPVVANVNQVASTPDQDFDSTNDPFLMLGAPPQSSTTRRSSVNTSANNTAAKSSPQPAVEKSTPQPTPQPAIVNDPFAMLASMDFNTVNTTPTTSTSARAVNSPELDPFTALLGNTAPAQRNVQDDPFAMLSAPTSAAPQQNKYASPSTTFVDPFASLVGGNGVNAAYNPYTLQQQPVMQPAMQQAQPYQQPYQQAQPPVAGALVEFNATPVPQMMANPYLNVGQTSFLTAQYNPYHDPYVISNMHQQVDVIAVRPPTQHTQPTHQANPFDVFQ